MNKKHVLIRVGLIAAVLLAMGALQSADFGGDTDYEPCEPIMTAPNVDMKCVDGDWVDFSNESDLMCGPVDPVCEVEG